MGDKIGITAVEGVSNQEEENRRTFNSQGFQQNVRAWIGIDLAPLDSSLRTLMIKTSMTCVNLKTFEKKGWQP
eukprot:2523263-Ditylum_brightwellii.AAC.1